MKDVSRSLCLCLLLSSVALVTTACDVDPPVEQKPRPQLEAAIRAVDADLADRAAETDEVRVRLLRLRIRDTSSLTDKSGGLPDLFVQLFEDGVKVAQSSTREGWFVEFPKQAQNIWTVRPGASYSMQIIDDDPAWLLNPDDRLFEIVGLTMDDFLAGTPIFEDRGPLTPSDQCASLEFEVIR